ncbi:hypothetical protein AB3S75_044651 [Citrus x aurantiifolia]
MTKRVWGLHNPSPMALSPGRLIRAVNPTCTLYTGPGFRLTCKSGASRLLAPFQNSSWDDWDDLCRLLPTLRVII